MAGSCSDRARRSLLTGHRDVSVNAVHAMVLLGWITGLGADGSMRRASAGKNGAMQATSSAGVRGLLERQQFSAR